MESLINLQTCCGQPNSIVSKYRFSMRVIVFHSLAKPASRALSTVQSPTHQTATHTWVQNAVFATSSIATHSVLVLPKVAVQEKQLPNGYSMADQSLISGASIAAVTRTTQQRNTQSTKRSRCTRTNMQWAFHLKSAQQVDLDTFRRCTTCSKKRVLHTALAVVGSDQHISIQRAKSPTTLFRSSAKTVGAKWWPKNVKQPVTPLRCSTCQALPRLKFRAQAPLPSSTTSSAPSCQRLAA